jgi:hypothetical protein
VGDALRPLLHGAGLPRRPQVAPSHPFGADFVENGDCKPGESRHDVNMDRRDRVLDWQEELLRIAPRLAELPDAARQAVYEVVAEFLREDAEPAPARLAHAA